MLIYNCLTPCICTCNYLWCLNACQWRYGLQTIFRTFTRGSILLNYLIDGYCHLLFICYALITQYYHNITQLDVKCLHLICYSTLPNRGPPHSLNHSTLWTIHNGVFGAPNVCNGAPIDEITLSPFIAQKLLLFSIF